VVVEFKISFLEFKNVYKMLLVFDKFFDKMNQEDQRKLIEAMISEIYLHPKETLI